MADDEKAVKAEDPRPSAATTSLSRSEWTASDTRGPLETAEERRFQADRFGDADVARPIDADAPGTTGLEPEPADGMGPEGAAAAAPGEPAPTEGTGHTAGPDVVEAPGSGPAPVEAETPKRTLWPIAAGLIGGAVIGAGSAAIVYGLWSNGSSPDSRIAALETRVDALDKRPDPAGLAASVADLDHKVASLQRTAGTTPSASGASPSQAPTVDLEPLQKQVAALQARMDALKAQGSQTQALDTKIAALEGAVAGMKTEASSAQAGVQTVEGQQRTMASEQKLLADKVMVPGLAVVADSLVQQIDQGQPYAAQVAALEGLDADPAKIAILKQNADRGVLSAKALAAKFAPLAEPISATAHKAPPNAGFVDRLKSGMLSMVSVRSVDDTAGNDPASRAAQIGTDLAHDDVAGALATWNALPADARPKGGEDWSLLAKAHVEAMAAARALQHDAIVALGAKKS